MVETNVITLSLNSDRIPFCLVSSSAVFTAISMSCGKSGTGGLKQTRTLASQNVTIQEPVNLNTV